MEKKELDHYTAQGIAEINAQALARDEDTMELLSGVEGIDIRQELGTARFNVINRGDTPDEAMHKKERRRYVIGIERALKSAGFKANSKCPCGSNKKFKKCCKVLLDDVSVDVEYIATKLNLRRQDEFAVNPLHELNGAKVF